VGVEAPSRTSSRAKEEEDREAKGEAQAEVTEQHRLHRSVNVTVYGRFPMSLLF